MGADASPWLNRVSAPGIKVLLDLPVASFSSHAMEAGDFFDTEGKDACCR